MIKVSLSEEKLNRKKSDRPIKNGCGSYAVTVDFDSLGMDGFNECCNTHDICYHERIESKEVCDNKFYYCLSNQCFTSSFKYNWNLLEKFGRIVLR